MPHHPAITGALGEARIAEQRQIAADRTLLGPRRIAGRLGRRRFARPGADAPRIRPSFPLT